MSESGVYLYAVSRGLHADDVNGLVGLQGDPVRVLDGHGLSAVVGDVGLDEFGDEGLRRNLEDLAWLEQVARQHDAVVRGVARRGVLAPMRLATVFLNDDSVVERLGEWGSALQRALDRVEGRSEWSVKVYVSLEEIEAEGRAAAHSRPAGGGAGAAYLQRRRSQITQREDALGAASELGDSIYTRLAHSVAASRRLPPQDRRLTGHEGTMVLNAAYLVGHDDEATWTSTVDAIVAERPQARVELQGPWPPYSFATVEDA